MGTDIIEGLDRQLEELRKQNPDATFAEYYAGLVLKQIQEGNSHATLGPKLRKEGDWWETGAKKFDQLRRHSGIKENSHVIDYGCGSLRLGGHFIRYLNPDCFLGLDVISDFYEMGKDFVGQELIKEKRPQFGVIGEKSSTTAAIEFNADFVFSSAVAFHVHPDELTTYFDNLTRFAHKPGAILLFDAMLADRHFRYSHRGWTWPLDFYVNSLGALDFVTMHNPRERRGAGKKFTVTLLEFRRPV